MLFVVLVAAVVVSVQIRIFSVLLVLFVSFAFGWCESAMETVISMFLLQVQIVCIQKAAHFPLAVEVAVAMTQSRVKCYFWKASGRVWQAANSICEGLNFP